MERDRVTVFEKDGYLYMENERVRFSFDLKKGTYRVEAGKDGNRRVLLEDARAQVDGRKSGESGSFCEWRKEDVSDGLGTGVMARISCGGGEDGRILLGVTLYEGKGFLAFACGYENRTQEPVQVREMSPLAGACVFRKYGEMKNVRLLDGNGGAFVTEVRHGLQKLESRNNAMLMWEAQDRTYTLVAGGLRYQDFAKYVRITPAGEGEYALLDVYAADPHGRKVDGGTVYFPGKDAFYLDITTEDPFQAMEDYGQTLRIAQGAYPNAYQFPSVCLWYAEFYDMLGDGKEMPNTSAGAVREMETIRDRGFLKYAPVAVRLVPDYYGENHQGGNTQQGWWDDAHWQKYQDPEEGNGRYVEPFETSRKWAQAVLGLGGIPLTYFQAGAVSEDYANAHPDHMLFNNGRSIPGEWLNGSYQADVGYDFTDPGFQEHMRKVYRDLKDAGMKGLMFDYPGTVWDEEGGFEDPHATTANNYINVFRLAKEGLGEGSYVHERGIETGYDLALGWVDSQRTEDDTADMPPEMVRKVGLRWYKNRVVTNYDMDSKDLMRAQSVDELRTLVTMAYAVSGRLLLANGFRNLTEEAIYALSRTYPQHSQKKSFRPVDAFLKKEYPQIYDYDVDEQWHQVIFYNGDRLHDQAIGVCFGQDRVSGGLGMEKDAAYYVYDFWNDQYIGRFEGTQTLKQRVRKGESRVLSVHKDLGIPQVLSTSRHIMQGLTDLDSVLWQEEEGILSGRSAVVAEEEYRVKIILPEDGRYTFPRPARMGARGSVRVEYDPCENMVTLILLCRENCRTDWQVFLERTAEEEGEKAAAPENVEGKWDPETFCMNLSWNGSEENLYRIYAETGRECEPDPLYLVGKTGQCRFTDTGICDHIPRYYQITATDRQGHVSEAAHFCIRADYTKPVRFLGLDRDTGGNWHEKYGRQGYSLRGLSGPEKLPGYVHRIVSNGHAGENNGKEGDFFPQLPDGQGGYHGFESNRGILSYTVEAEDRAWHRAAFYCLDTTYDKFGSIASKRKMMLELKSASGKVMEEDIPVEQFGEGVFICVSFQGSFTLTLRNMVYIGVFDSVCSGIFFDPDEGPEAC